MERKEMSKELYKVNIYTDLAIGDIKELEPITDDTLPSSNRKTIYLGMSQIITPKGPMPIEFTIDALILSEAVEKFSAAAEAKLEILKKQALEAQAQKEKENLIITPENSGKLI